MLKHSLPSIEQFAAFLDGNMSQSDMIHFSQMAEQDNVLHKLLDASSEVDNTLADFMESDLQLPSEIMGLDFELPEIAAEGIPSLVTLTPEPIDEILFAAGAINDMSMLTENDQEELQITGDDIHDNTTCSMPNGDSLDNNIEDLSNPISEDL